MKKSSKVFYHIINAIFVLGLIFCFFWYKDAPTLLFIFLCLVMAISEWINGCDYMDLKEKLKGYKDLYEQSANVIESYKKLDVTHKKVVEHYNSIIGSVVKEAEENKGKLSDGTIKNLKEIFEKIEEIKKEE